MPLCDVAAESTSASDIDEPALAGVTEGDTTEHVPSDDSMQISPPGPAGLAGLEIPPDPLATSTTPSASSLEGEVSLPSPLCLPSVAVSPSVCRHGNVRDGPSPLTEARQQPKRAGARAPSPVLVSKGSRLSDDKSAAVGTAGSKRKAIFPSEPSVQPSSTHDLKRTKMHFRPIDPAPAHRDGSASSSSS